MTKIRVFGYYANINGVIQSNVYKIREDRDLISDNLWDDNVGVYIKQFELMVVK